MITKFINSNRSYSAILKNTGDNKDQNLLIVIYLFDKFLMLHMDLVSLSTVLSENLITKKVYEEGVFNLYPYEVRGNRIISKYSEGNQTYTIEFEETFFGNLLFSYSVEGVVMDWFNGIHMGVQNRELIKKQKLTEYYGGWHTDLIPKFMRVLNIKIYEGTQHENSLFIVSELNPSEFINSMKPLAIVLAKTFDGRGLTWGKIDTSFFLKKYRQETLNKLLELHLVELNSYSLEISMTERGKGLFHLYLEKSIESFW